MDCLSIAALECLQAQACALSILHIDGRRLYGEDFIPEDDLDEVGDESDEEDTDDDDDVESFFKPDNLPDWATKIMVQAVFCLADKEATLGYFDDLRSGKMAWAEFTKLCGETLNERLTVPKSWKGRSPMDCLREAVNLAAREEAIADKTEAPMLLEAGPSGAC